MMPWVYDIGAIFFSETYLVMWIISGRPHLLPTTFPNTDFGQANLTESQPRDHRAGYKVLAAGLQGLPNIEYSISKEKLKMAPLCDGHAWR